MRTPDHAAIAEHTERIESLFEGLNRGRMLKEELVAELTTSRRRVRPYFFFR